MEVHPLCKILPAMTTDEYEGLVVDIRKSGLIRAITTYEGMILDGRHRFNACADAGVDPRFDEYTGTDPASFVASSCVHRNLSYRQRLLIAAGFLEYEREQAKSRVSASGGNRIAGVEKFPPPVEDTGKARDKAGARMGVSGRVVSDAATVIARAVPEVMEKFRSEDMSVKEAARIVKLNPQAQRRIAAIDDKDARSKEITKAFEMSAACKHRDAPKREVDKLPGTSFLRKYLSALERLAMLCAEDGLKDGVSIAAAFDRDMDWTSTPLSMQYDRTRPVLDAISIIEKYRRAA